MPGWLRGLLEGLAFTSLIPAGVAAVLLLAAGAALGQEPDWVTASLAATGTLFVYGVDRMRGLEADRAKAPARAAFVERHRPALLALTVATGIVAAVLAWRAPLEVQLLCAAVAAAGLLHRRLKRFAIAKPVYVTAAWVAVTAGIPALSSEDPASVARVGWVVAIHTGAIGANLFAANRRVRTAWVLGLAGAACLAVAPPPVRTLAVAPALQVAVLAAYRPAERFFALELDLALLAGGLAALLLLGV